MVVKRSNNLQLNITQTETSHLNQLKWDTVKQGRIEPDLVLDT